MCRNLQVLAQPEIVSATSNSTTPQNPEMIPSKLAHDHLFLTASSTMLVGFSHSRHQCRSRLPSVQVSAAPDQPPVAFLPATLVSPHCSSLPTSALEIQIVQTSIPFQSQGVKQAFSFHLEVPGTSRRATSAKRTKRRSTMDIVLS
jgi:hypothetical protein